MARPDLHSDNRWWWRIAFAVYAVALTTTTHWPRVDLGEAGEAAISPDKMLHVYTFAAITAVLWMTGWVRRLRVLLLIMTVWVVTDELTQALPGLERQVTLRDVVCSFSGVLIAIVWVWALSPVGGRLSRTRSALRARVMMSLFDQPFSSRSGLTSWMLLGLAFVVVAVSIVFIWPHAVAALPNGIFAAMYGGAIAAWLGILAAVWNRMWRARLAEARELNRCPTCVHPLRDASIGQDGLVYCDQCGSSNHVGIWLEDIQPHSSLQHRLVRRPILIGFAFLLITFGGIFGFAALYGLLEQGEAVAQWMRRITREFNNLSLDFTLTIDLVIILLATAVAVRSYRIAWSRIYEGQGEKCRRCEYDLRGTSTHNGLGTCGECGTPFARARDDSPRGSPNA